MGWMIEIKEDKYRVWSTVVDDYITEPMDKDELIRFLFWSKFETLIEDMLEEMVCFPHNWTDKETGKRLVCDKSKYDEYFALLNNRVEKFKYFLSKIKDAGIFLDMKDVDNVCLYTESNGT